MAGPRQSEINATLAIVKNSFLNFITASFHQINISFKLQKIRLEFINFTRPVIESISLLLRRISTSFPGSAEISVLA
jgi:hypothetical protein